MTDAPLDRGLRELAEAVGSAAAPQLEGLGEDELGRLAAAMEAVEVPATKVVIEEGAAGDGLYVVGSGRVLITRGGATFHEHDRTIGTLGDGEFFGEMSLLLDEAPCATVRAAGDTVVYRLTKSTFDDMLSKGEMAAYKVILNVAKGLCRRLRGLDDSLTNLMGEAKTTDAAPKIDLDELRERYFKQGYVV